MSKGPSDYLMIRFQLGYNNSVAAGTKFPRESLTSKVVRTFTWKMGTQCLSPGMTKYLSKPGGIRSTRGMRNMATSNIK